MKNLLHLNGFRYRNNLIYLIKLFIYLIYFYAALPATN